MNFRKLSTIFSVVSITILISISAFSENIENFNVVDLAGRPLSFDNTPQRIILGESRYLSALAILDPNNPLKHVVGMLGSLEKIDFGTYQQYKKKFPEIDDVAIVGHTTADSFSIEKVLSLQADLAVFGVDGHGPNSHHTQLIKQLKQAGIEVVFLDFRNDPLVNTVKSITLLGDILGREKQAKQFTDYYQQQLNVVNRGLSNLDSSEPKPNVFLHSRVGLQDLCCETMVRGMMASFLKQVDGNNIAEDLIPGLAGVLNIEYLLTHQPEIYIATAIGGYETYSVESPVEEKNIPPYIVLGAGVTDDIAKKSFAKALSHTHMNELNAIKSKKAYAIWHHFYNTPLNIAAVQVFAKWLYPETFAELQPRQTLETLFNRFQAVPLEGTYWLQLDNTDKDDWNQVTENTINPDNVSMSQVGVTL